MKRAGFFKGVFDGFRSSGTQPSKDKTEPVEQSGSVSLEPVVDSSWEHQETLRSEHFKVAKTVRHGFPHKPTAVAFDPVQRLLAVGTKYGFVRIFGRPGVVHHLSHKRDDPVIQLVFIINEGNLISVCGDDCVQLWDLKPKTPEIVHTLKFQRERVRCCHMPFQSRWMYVGTEKGNIHIVNVESFVLSGYIIHWNKAIELSCRNHPGVVVHLSDNPLDSNKLLIGYSSGLVVMWDLRSRAADIRFHPTEPVRSISWNQDGRQFICSHSDGSLSTWNIRSPLKPQSFIYPHSKASSDGKLEPCKPIHKVDWKITRTGESLIIFSGGLPYEETGQSPSLTIQQGKATTVLEMDYNITDFITLCETPWQTDYQEPYAVVVLLEEDLVLVDLTSPGFPTFQNPYPMGIHKPPVTFCTYIADCPDDLIPALYSLASIGGKHVGCSEKEWPITGGEWGSSTTSCADIVITGHSDGTMQFWDASSVFFQVFYRLKTAKVFQPLSKSFEEEEDPFAIDQVAFCPESRVLCVAGTSCYIIVHSFSRTESVDSVAVVEIPIKCDAELSDANRKGDNPVFDFSAAGSVNNTQKHPLNVKTGDIKKPPGFQAQLVCLCPLSSGETSGRITVLTVNTSYGLMAYGTEFGLTIVDIVQKVCLLSMATQDLYGSADPYNRMPHSPRRPSSGQDQESSQTTDEVNGPCLSPTPRHSRKSVAQPDSRSGDTSEKLENSENNLSRSRSSSACSLTNLSEGVFCLKFAQSYGSKADTVSSPSLWVGTNFGSVFVFLLMLPPPGEDRQLQPVIISPSGTIYRLNGAVLNISLLDVNNVQDSNDSSNESKDNREEKEPRMSLRSVSPLPMMNEKRDKQFLIMTSEIEAQVHLLPSQVFLFKSSVASTSTLVKADVSYIKDLGSSCLACCLQSGHVKILGLPSLRTLLMTEFLPVVGMRILKTFCFGKNGHGIYLASPSEVQRFTISASFCGYLQEMIGTLFLQKDMPEPPKQSFFKGLFGGTPSVLDREELFGETSGKSSKGVALSYKGSSGLEHAKSQSSSLAGEVSRARQGLIEREEKLSKLEERTARLMTEAEVYSRTSHQLMLKYKDKKWYQL